MIVSHIGQVVYHDGPEITYFNLQTTGFEFNAQIIQLSAINSYGEFCSYVLPKVKINPRAAAMNGFEVRNGRLYQFNEEKPTVPLKNAFLNFVHFLSQTQREHLLVSHNGKRFHNKRLMSEISVMKMNPTFKPHIIGFNDTQPLIRLKIISRANQPGALRLRALDRDYLGSAYASRFNIGTNNLHLLREIVHYFNIDLLNQTNWVSYNQQRALHFDMIARRKVRRTLEPLRGFLSDFMISRFAYHKITMDQLVSAFNQGGEDAVKELLKSPNNCRKRCITRVERILNAAARGVHEIAMNQGR